MTQTTVNTKVCGKSAAWLRKNGWKPYLHVYDCDGNTCELISYPYDENGIAVIKVRTIVGDPGSMVTMPCDQLWTVMTAAIAKRRTELRNQRKCVRPFDLHKAGALSVLQEHHPYITGPGWYHDDDDVMFVSQKGESFIGYIWLQCKLEEVKDNDLPVTKVKGVL